MMKPFLIVTSLFAVGGCAASLREHRQADLRQRASFELSCPAEQLEIVPLDSAAASHGGGTTGVNGCGRKATYIWDAYGTGWILNSSTKHAKRLAD
jgi:hypothetical protein